MRMKQMMICRILPGIKNKSFPNLLTRKPLRLALGYGQGRTAKNNRRNPNSIRNNLLLVFHHNIQIGQLSFQTDCNLIVWGLLFLWVLDEAKLSLQLKPKTT